MATFIVLASFTDQGIRNVKETIGRAEAFKEMAERKLAEIGESIRTRWGLDRVAITHRVGRLDLGEASVVIAVASPHRAEAFEACRHAIETLKKTVPIWKKEVWEGGEMWVGMEGTDDPETE